ncbi:MAG: NYN domain-containing protein [Gammaproteobacteria bacterium]|nr:NYN domain-containing protein [Gammaproteobacteria bacterium]
MFSANVGYGHTLLSALPGRLSSRSIHLPNTLRQQMPHRPPVEKMVDAALAADLLYWAFSDIGDWALVLSNDDDVIPPALTAEAKTASAGRRVFILKTTRWQSHLMDLHGLLLETG